MSKRKVVGTQADPTLQTTEVTINGKVFTLCFDLGALAEAERHFRRQGEDVNLLEAMSETTLSSTRTFFPCAIRRFHPEIGFKEAQAMVTMYNAVPIAMAIVAAWNQAKPEPETEKGDKQDSPHQP